MYRRRRRRLSSPSPWLRPVRQWYQTLVRAFPSVPKVPSRPAASPGSSVAAEPPVNPVAARPVAHLPPVTPSCHGAVARTLRVRSARPSPRCGASEARPDLNVGPDDMLRRGQTAASWYADESETRENPEKITADRWSRPVLRSEVKVSWHGATVVGESLVTDRHAVAGSGRVSARVRQRYGFQVFLRATVSARRRRRRPRCCCTDPARAMRSVFKVLSPSWRFSLCSQHSSSRPSPPCSTMGLLFSKIWSYFGTEGKSRPLVVFTPVWC